MSNELVCDCVYSKILQWMMALSLQEELLIRKPRYIISHTSSQEAYQAVRPDLFPEANIVKEAPVEWWIHILSVTPTQMT